jgi:anti-sigma B factor antagonist
MEIQTKQNDTCVTLTLSGRFDASVAGSIKETISELIDRDNIHYVIDLSDVSYMDSGGLGSLVASLRRVREREGDIKLSAPNCNVRKVFELTRTHRIFEFYDNSTLAAQSFQSA